MDAILQSNEKSHQNGADGHTGIASQRKNAHIFGFTVFIA